MRTISADRIRDTVAELCVRANRQLPEDIVKAIESAGQKESWPTAKYTLDILQENMALAKERELPVCQDTGMACVFLELGQDVHVEGDINEAIHEGVRRGYEEGYLRKSIVADPLRRGNTGDNTPAAITVHLVPGDGLKITVAPKGFGSENMSRLAMLKPADGIEGVKNAVIEAVSAAGPNACPPLVVGVGIGGDFEKCAILAKKALTRETGLHSDIPWIKELEEEMLERINKTGIGPAGMGGRITAMAVNIDTYPTHIAGLPVAVNICCHVNRHIVKTV